MNEAESKTVRRREQRKRAKNRRASYRAKKRERRERLEFLEADVLRLRGVVADAHKSDRHPLDLLGLPCECPDCEAHRLSEESAGG